MRDPRKLLLFACFFVSGATSLVLQVAWSKELSYILGNTLYAVATVVAAFMAGLGLGSGFASRFAARIRRPILAYAGLQVFIAVAGAVSIPVFRATRPLFRMAYGSLEAGDWTFLLARFAIVAGLVLVPVILMGMTLPIVVGAFARRKPEYALEAGLVYGINTLGAVVGTWSAGFLLVPALGLFATTLVAAGADVTVAVLAFGLAAAVERRARGAVDATTDSAETTTTAPPDTEIPRTSTPHRARRREATVIGIAFLVSGALAMIYEVAWFRLLAMTMGPTVYAFSSMLGMFLLGVGAGSVAFAPIANRSRLSGGQLMAWLEVALGMTVLAGMLWINALPRWNAELYFSVRGALGAAGFPVSHLAIAALVVLPPCLVLGALFPTTVRAFREAGGADSAESNVGRLYILNTGGGIVGTLAAGFFLLPRVGLATTLVVSGIASIVIGMALFGLAGNAPRKRRTVSAAFAGGVAIVLVVIAPPLDRVAFNLGLYREVYSATTFHAERLYSSEVVFYEQGINCPVTVFRSPDNHASLHVTGKADASTRTGDQATQTLLGHLPALLAADPRDVAVIGYGSGMTVAAFLEHDAVASIDVLEIERAVVNASVYFECINDNPLDDPRTNLIVEDGRVHLTYTDRTYDVIVSEPSNPWIAGVANLFTADFYRIANERLAPGGLFAQWIQAYDISPLSLAGVLCSLADTFEHVLLFRTAPGDFLALASQEPVRCDFETFSNRFESPTVRESIERIGYQDALALAGTLYGPEADLAALLEPIDVRNTDDNVWLEYRMPRDLMGVGWEEHEAIFPVWIAPERLLAGFEAIVPGLPVGPCARAIVEEIHDFEPTRYQSNVAPLWQPTRDALIGGFEAAAATPEYRGELRQLGSWTNAAERALRARLTAAATLLDPRRDLSRNVTALEQVVASAPELPMARIAAGNAQAGAGDLTAARRHFERAAERPDSLLLPRAWLGLASVAAAQGDTAIAEEHYRRTMRRFPYDPDSFVGLAALLHAEGRAKEVERVLEEARRFHPYDDRFKSQRR